jgi:tetratricopeptide (TPR) repeat protein
MPVHRLLLARAQAVNNDRPAALKTLADAATQILAAPGSAARDALMKEWYETLAVAVPPNQFAQQSETAFGALDDPWPTALLGHQLYLASTRAQSTDASVLRESGIQYMVEAREAIKSQPPTEERTKRLQMELGWNLADAYYSAGESAKAVEMWRWFLEASPDHFATLNNLAFVLASDLNDPVAALDPARRAYELSPTDATMLDTYGYVLFRNNRLDEAERFLRESLNREEQSGARMHLGQVLAARGKTEDARLELNRARNLSEQQGNSKRVKEIDELLKDL